MAWSDTGMWWVGWNRRRASHLGSRWLVRGGHDMFVENDSARGEHTAWPWPAERRGGSIVFWEDAASVGRIGYWYIVQDECGRSAIISR